LRGSKPPLRQSLPQFGQVSRADRPAVRCRRPSRARPPTDGAALGDGPVRACPVRWQDVEEEVPDGAFRQAVVPLGGKPDPSDPRGLMGVRRPERDEGPGWDASPEGTTKPGELDAPGKIGWDDL